MPVPRNPDAMRRHASVLTRRALFSFLVSVLALVMACSVPPERAILGTWVLDAVPSEPSVPALAAPTQTSLLRYRFDAGGEVQIVYSDADSAWRRSARWRVGNQDGPRQYYRIESGRADADWRDYGVYLSGGHLVAPHPTTPDAWVALRHAPGPAADPPLPEVLPGRLRLSMR